METGHGAIETPAYAIVGTQAAVRCLDAEDLARAKTQLVMVNTYHMWRKLGDVKLAGFPGLHKEMNWNRPLMTDSGGFQVFSLGAAREHNVGKVAPIGDIANKKVLRSDGENFVRVTEDGVNFTDNGEEFYLDAEKSMLIQERLGADIIFSFDECTSPFHDYEYTKKSMERTHRWAVRSLRARTSDQLLFGIVQGGAFENLRRESAEFIGRLSFDGFAIGGAFGSSFGSSKEETFRELDWSIPFLPKEKPRHLLGIGRPEDLFLGVEAGIDFFDCVVPTREARHGSVWTAAGRLDITRGRYAEDSGALEEGCFCPVCAEQKLSRKFLYALFKEKNPSAGRLASLHNVFFFNDLMGKIRRAIFEDNLEELKKQYLRIS